MSAGFEFKKKREVTICGKSYPCDFSDSRMLEGVARDFPQILKASQDLIDLDRQVKAAIKNGKASASYTDALLEKNKKLVEVCRKFIEGTIGTEEYAEIFSDREENSSEHIELCAYIYSEIMEGRREMVEEYLTPEAKEAVAHDGAEITDNRTSEYDYGEENPDGLAVVAPKRGLRARIASALGRKAGRSVTERI